MVVGDFEAEFVFHGHNDFDVVQGVQTEVLDEVRFHGQLEIINVELTSSGHSELSPYSTSHGMVPPKVQYRQKVCLTVSFYFFRQTSRHCTLKMSETNGEVTTE